MNILAIKLREIGDTVLLTSSLMALRAKYPTARIDVLTLSANQAILEHHEAIDDLYLIDNRSGFRFLAMLIKLRFKSYDLALGFHASSSLCLFVRLAGAKENILHHHGRTTTPSRSDRLLKKPGRLQNALLRDYEILKAIGIYHQPSPTKICVSSIEKKWAIDRLNEIGLPASDGILALLPGASSATKRYDLESWTYLIRNLAAKGVNSVVLVDRSLSQAWSLRKVCREANVPIVDDANLREFVSLISLCQQAVTMDSSPLHIAVALGLRTYSIFGPSCLGDWHPYDKREHFVYRFHVDCRNEGPRQLEDFQYCSIRHCEHNSCMKHDPEKILANVVSQM